MSPEPAGRGRKEASWSCTQRLPEKLPALELWGPATIEPVTGESPVYRTWGFPEDSTGEKAGPQSLGRRELVLAFAD